MKKTVPIWVSIILVLLSIGSTFVQCYQITNTLTNDDVGVGLISNIILFVGSLFSLMYCLVGYKKDSSVYYKYFSLLYLIFVFVDVCLRSSNIGFGHYIFTGCIALIAASVLFFAKDLGKLKSFIFGGILVFMAAIDMIAAIVLKNSLSFISYFVLAVIFGIMIYGKYVDKTARGTK